MPDFGLFKTADLEALIKELPAEAQRVVNELAEVLEVIDKKDHTGEKRTAGIRTLAEYSSHTGLQRAVLTILKNKLPGDHITYKEVIRLIHYFNAIGLVIMPCFPSDPLPSPNDIAFAIGSLMDSGEIGSDMELYLTDRKG